MVYSSCPAGGWRAMHVQSHSRTQWEWPQRMFIHNTGDKDGEVNHMKYKTHTCHRYISGAIPVSPNKKDSGLTWGTADITNWIKRTTQAAGEGQQVKGHTGDNPYTQREGGNKGNTPPMQWDMRLVMSMIEVVCLPSSRVTWLALNVKGDQATIPELLWQE